MSRILLILILSIFSHLSLHAISNSEKFEGRFEGWNQKRLELIALFLPKKPMILLASEQQDLETASFKALWPDSTLIMDSEFQKQGTQNIDLLRLNSEESALKTLMEYPHILSNVKCIYAKTNLLPSQKGLTPYHELRHLLENSGFRLLAHWYPEGQQGDAIFIKGNFYDDFPSNEVIDKIWDSVKSNYKRHFVPFPIAFFYLDDINDSIKSILKLRCPWEGNAGLIIEEYSKVGSVVIDVGAHIGVHTITMSKKIGPEGAVIAFEPQKKIYLEQLQNLKFNNCTNVISICKAIGETAKIVQMTKVDPSNEGGTGIGEGGDYVEMIPLDSLNLTNVSLIKIDVEDYEFFTLIGARETILRNKPVIVFELNGSNVISTPAEEVENYDRVMALIKSYGYEIFCMHNKDFIAFPSDSKEALSDFGATQERIIHAYNMQNQELDMESP